MRIIKAVFLLAMLTTFSTSYGQIAFQKMSIEEAKAKAASTNKNIFMDFRADWCKPCVAMERTTFRDEQVAKAINENYIPVKVDVDYFEGMDLKELYNVSVLPTILIINERGEVQMRMIGQKSAQSLMAELGYKYESNPNEPSTTDDDSEDVPRTEKKAKKECFLKRWFNKIKG
jgi:thiol:disulfide interchange protein